MPSTESYKTQKLCTDLLFITLYLEFFGEVISYYGGEGREEGSQEYTNISDVNGNVEEVQNMVNRC